MFFKFLIFHPNLFFKIIKNTPLSSSIRKYVQNLYSRIILMGIDGDLFHFEFGNYAADFVDFIEICNKPTIVSFRGADLDIYPLKNKYLGQKYATVFKIVDKLHFVSEALSKNAEKYGYHSKFFINRPSTDEKFLEKELILNPMKMYKLLLLQG